MTSKREVIVQKLNTEQEYQRLLGGSPQTCGMHSGRVYLTAGQACGQHSTKNHEEMLIFLAGGGELLIGDDSSFEVGIGRVSYIPPNTIHDVKNTGSEPLIYIFCVVPVTE